MKLLATFPIINNGTRLHGLGQAVAIIPVGKSIDPSREKKE
jgi:hypothetical protein